MNDKALKELLSDAYEVKRTDRQRQFIRKYRKRELKISELLYIQFRYMRWSFWAIVLCLIGIAGFIVGYADAESVNYIAALMPIPAVIALMELGKSDRCKMSELEMTTRLSKRMLKSLRLVLVGLAGLVSIGVVAMIYIFALKVSIGAAFLRLSLPYIITTTACMMLIRRWHSKDNIYGCIAIAMCVCVIAVSFSKTSAFTVWALGKGIGVVLLIVSFGVMIREIDLYLKEKEELQWNLC